MSPACKFVREVIKIKEVPLFSPNELVSDESGHTHQRSLNLVFSILHSWKLSSISFWLPLLSRRWHFGYITKSCTSQQGSGVFNAKYRWHWWLNRKVSALWRRSEEPMVFMCVFSANIVLIISGIELNRSISTALWLTFSISLVCFSG